MATKRLFYACRRAGIAPGIGAQKPDFKTIRGLQSIGITTNFSLTQAFEIGKLTIYENIEGVPDVEATMEKVLDGYCPIYLLATQTQADSTSPPTSATLAGRAPTKCILGLQIMEEDISVAGHVGVAETGAASEGLRSELHMSGLYVSSVRYSANINDNATESVTVVGNNKVWVLGGDTGNFNAAFQYGGGTWDAPWTGASWPNGGLYPASISGSGGIQRREDILLDPTTAIAGGAKSYSILPIDIPGIVPSPSASPTGINIGNGSYLTSYAAGTFGINPLVGTEFPVHIQSWTVSVDMGREQLFELGRMGAYYRFINWPVEVTNEITVITTSGDMVSASEEGIYTNPGVGCGLKYNLKSYSIRMAMCEGLIVDCGESNKLRSVGMTGGDTSGGNVEVTYTYTNFNDFTVIHPKDVATGLRP